MQTVTASGQTNIKNNQLISSQAKFCAPVIFAKDCERCVGFATHKNNLLLCHNTKKKG